MICAARRHSLKRTFRHAAASLAAESPICGTLRPPAGRLSRDRPTHPLRPPDHDGRTERTQDGEPDPPTRRAILGTGWTAYLDNGPLQPGRIGRQVNLNHNGRASEVAGPVDVYGPSNGTRTWNVDHRADQVSVVVAECPAILRNDGAGRAGTATSVKALTSGPLSLRGFQEHGLDWHGPQACRPSSGPDSYRLGARPKCIRRTPRPEAR
jgi:hypothetical protein